MSTSSETFGQRLKRLRKAAGLSQAQLADAAHCSRTTINRWERSLFFPDWLAVQKLAKALGAQMEDFLEIRKNGIA